MGVTKRRGGGTLVAILGAAVTLGTLGDGQATVSGCRVAENDVKRWESTQRGPYKLVAVVTHDKYSWELRTDAALSLIRMPPRGGARQGIAFLVDKYKDEEGETRDGALNQLPEDARRQIVDRLAPLLIKELEPPPPPRTPEGRLPADPTIPFKDATFAMLVHEPPLVSNDKTRAELRAALTKWASTGFEDRIENGSQQFGLEQMMRFLGPESVKTLPGIINENASRIDRIAGLINDVGDEATKLKASEALVALAQKYNSKEWLEAQTKVVKESNARNNVKADDTQVAGQVDKIQERNLTEAVFPAMKRVGGRPAIDYLFALRRRREEQRRAPQARARGPRGARRQEQPERPRAHLRDREERGEPGRGSRRRVPAHGRVPEGADRPEALHALRAEEVEDALGRRRDRPEDVLVDVAGPRFPRAPARRRPP